MAQITITINSREYAIACEDGQEAHILQLSRLLDEKAKLLGDGVNQISESMLLAITEVSLIPCFSSIHSSIFLRPSASAGKVKTLSVITFSSLNSLFNILVLKN